MKYLLVLALAACAHAAVPAYFAACSNGEKGSNTLQKHWDKPEKEYMALTAAVTGVANLEVFLHLSYDQAYEFALILAEVGRGQPILIQELNKRRLALARGKTAKLRMLVKELCIPKDNKKPGVPAKCDEFVDEAVKKDKELQNEVPLFLAMGDLAFQYLTVEPELLDAVKTNKVDDFLLNGKAKLKPLAEQTAVVYRLLFGLS